MKIDLEEPYHIIATQSDEVRAVFWERALDFILGISWELWRRDVLALGKEKWIERRMKGCEAFMSPDELQEKREALNGLYAKLEKEHNERTT